MVNEKTLIFHSKNIKRKRKGIRLKMLRQVNLAVDGKGKNRLESLKTRNQDLNQKKNSKTRGDATTKRRQLMNSRNLRDRIDINRNNNGSKFRTNKGQTRIGKVLDFKRNDSFELKSPVRSDKIIISSKFGEERDGYVHRGIDIDGEQGERIYAAKEGEVVFSEETEQGGKEVIINHDNGLKTKYSHLDSINVEEGDRVTTETVLGEMGNTGEVHSSDENGDGAHLHYEVMKDGKHLNPESFLEDENVEYKRGDYGNSFTLSSCSGGSSGSSGSCGGSGGFSGSSGSCGGSMRTRSGSCSGGTRDTEDTDEIGTCSSTGVCSGNNPTEPDDSNEVDNGDGTTLEPIPDNPEIPDVSDVEQKTYDTYTFRLSDHIAGLAVRVISRAVDTVTTPYIPIPEWGSNAFKWDKMSTEVTVNGTEDGKIETTVRCRYYTDQDDYPDKHTEERVRRDTFEYDSEMGNYGGVTLEEIKTLYRAENVTVSD